MKKKIDFETPIEKEDYSIKKASIQEVTLREESMVIYFKQRHIAPITLYYHGADEDKVKDDKLIKGQLIDENSKVLTEEETAYIESLLPDDLFLILKKYISQILA